MAAGGAPVITPPEGCPLRAPFGVLKTARGLALVRLEDVHAWMMQRDGLPSASAVARVFGVFASDANSATGIEHGAAKVREFLHLTDLSGYAEPVSEFAGRHYLREVARLVPYVTHHHFDRGTPEALMYSLGLMAGEVWAPHAVDIELHDRLEGYFPDGKFPTVAKAREILGRLAVPFAAAHGLWGWGKVENEAAASSGQLTDWPALVAYRKANPGRGWGTGEQIAVGLAELKRRVDAGQTESDALEAMAKEIGLAGRESLRKPFKLLASDRKRVKKAAPTTPVTKVKDGLKAA